MPYLLYSYRFPSLSISSFNALNSLGISLLNKDHESKPFEYHGGYFGRMIDKRIYAISAAYNIALASTRGATLICPDEDSYTNLTFAKEKINENHRVLDAVKNILKQYNLTYNTETKIEYLGNILNDHLDKIILNLKSDFSKFSASLFFSSRTNSDLKSSVINIMNAIKLRVSYIDSYAFCDKEMFNPKLAYKYSAKSLENALDSGSDFIVSMSAEMSNMLEANRTKLSRAVNREFPNIPTLFLPQLILISMDKREEESLALTYHKHIPEFL